MESVRTFDAATQLSINTHKHFSIVPNVQGKMVQEGNGSFFEFAGKNTTIWIDSVDKTQEILKKEYTRSVEIHSKLPDTVKHTIPSNLYVDQTTFLSELKTFSTIELGTDTAFKIGLTCTFDFQP